MKVVYCIEGPKRGDATYGCSSRLEDAVAALERGRRRGIAWGEVVEHARAPRGLRVNMWLPPFDDRKAGFR